MENWDLIVLGAGPAGLSAAMWGSDLGLRTILIEAFSEPGGQLLSVHNPIKNYPGRDFANGREFRDSILDQIKRLGGISLTLSSAAVSADLINNTVTVNGERTFSANALIIATGVRRRELGLPGEREFVGKGILGSGVRDREQTVNKHVAIVGGGDAALENALLLSETAAKVTLVHRGEKFRARHEFLTRLAERQNVDVLLGATVTRIIGDDFLTAVEVTSNYETQTIECGHLLIRIGVQPNSEIFRDQIALDAAGYVNVDRACRTSLDNVFAVGDVASPLAPTIATAAGMAATAVKVIARDIAVK